MVNNVPTPPTPVNEPVLGYLPGSKERAELKAELLKQSNEVVEIPCIINGVEVYTDNVVEQVICLLYTSPSPRDGLLSRMPSSA